MKNLIKIGLVAMVSLAMIACSSTKIIDESQAKAEALKDAGLSEAEVVFVSVNYSEDDKEYSIKFNSETYMFDYDIDAVSGKVDSKDSELIVKAPAVDTPTTPETNSSMDAKNAALTHFGLGQVEVMNYMEEIDYKDNGTKVYEVSFIYNGYEYDAEIDATTFTVLEANRDMD